MKIQNSKIQKPEKSLNVKYLHFQLIKIDLFVRAAIRRWELAGQDISEKFRGLYISEDSVHQLIERPIGGNWGFGVDLPVEEQNTFQALLGKVDEELIQIRNRANQEKVILKIDQLIEIFQLSEFEFNAFMVCIAPNLDSKYERIYGFLQDDVTNRNASFGLILDLLVTEPGLEKVNYFSFFNDNSSLMKNELIILANDHQNTGKSILNQNYLVPKEIISWLIDDYQPNEKISKAIRFSDVSDPGESINIFDLPEDISTLTKQNPLFVLYGQDELQKQLISNHIAEISEKPLIYLNLVNLETSPIKDERILNLFFRDAKLCNAIPVVTNWDSLLIENNEMQTLVSKLSEFDESVIIFVDQIWPVIRNDESQIKPAVWIDCNHPSSSKRFEIWKKYLGEKSSISNKDLEMLTDQFNLTASQIQNAVFYAFDLAFKKQDNLTIDDLYEAARYYSSSHLNSLATKIHPRYNWEDIVLPEDGLSSLHELTNTIRFRTTVLDDWGVGKRLMPYSGVSALFAGPPGTGKTLAAQVIAAELKMDLYKIDLSTVVSKYIGETEKNLERIFSQAKNSNAILFFDEADSIFGKRSEVKDAHDRYANIEVGYLLQRMETYDGVVILATNLRSNLDDAFMRRIQFIIEFPFPDEMERRKIWRVLFPPDVPLSEEIDINELGDRFKLTGGSIRNVIISASFLAASENSAVNNNHLIHAIRRELQKMGRLVNESDLLLHHKEGNNGKNPK